MRSVGEVERAEAARQMPLGKPGAPAACAGIVAFADLRRPDLDDIVAAYRAASPALCGIRQGTARDENFPNGIVLRPAPARMMADPDFRRGLRGLGRQGLPFDAMIYHQQLPDLLALARDVPETQIVLDHIGCPLGVGVYAGRQLEVAEAWSSSMRALAACPNVRIKFGGLGMIILGAAQHLASTPPTSLALADTWRRWFDICIEEFGATRVMFESNFPLDKAMYSYAVLWNAFKRLAAGASADEKSALFGGTARSAYRLQFG